MQADKFLCILLMVSLFILQSLISSTAIDVTEFGAIGDGTTDDSRAFLEAWGAVCGERGDGAELIIPAGKTFMLQPLKFQGPCNSPTINVQVFGNIIAPNNRNDWTGVEDNWIVFSQINGLIVGGYGQIDGQGSSWWTQKDSFRPTALRFEKCNNLQVSGLRHINSPKAHIHIDNCNGVTISRLRITAPESSPNTDGIDVAGSTNVQIQECFIGTDVNIWFTLRDNIGDDCIAINSGSSFINISGVICGPGHGISIGSLGRDGDTATVEDVYVQDCSLTGTTNGARIKTWQGGSGYARKIAFQRITLDNVKNPIIIDQYYCDKDSACQNQTSAVEVSNVFYGGFLGTSSTENAITFRCSETVPCSDVYLSDINIQSVETGRIAEGICFSVQGTSTLALPGLQCLSVTRDPLQGGEPETEPRNPPEGGDQPPSGGMWPPVLPGYQPPGAWQRPPWVVEGGGKQLGVQQAFLILFLSSVIYFRYIHCLLD